MYTVSETEFIESDDVIPLSGKYSFLTHADPKDDEGKCDPLPAERIITLLKGDFAPKLFLCQHKARWKLESS